MKVVLGVGVNIPSQEEDYLQFDNNSSLSDADIVIFNPDFNETSYDYEYSNGTFQGKRLYDGDSSFKIIEHTNHWQNEISIALDAGKVIFVTLTEKVDFFIHTGKKDTSGTGRNQKVTNIVDTFHNYKFLNKLDVEILSSKGSKIYPCSNLINDLHDCCKDYFKLEAYLKPKETIIKPLFTTKSKDKILGSHSEVANGHLVFIPAMNLPDGFYNENGEYTEEAFIWGRRFKKALFEIATSLKSTTQKTPRPDWTHDEFFDLAGSNVTKQLINEKKENLRKIEDDIIQLEEVLKEQEDLKDLLFETGKPLEHAVNKALKVLGYCAEGFDDGRLELDQVITSPEGDRFIGECEGKDNRDIDVSKFRQLLDSLNEDFARDEVDEKAYGILFGNPQRLLIPNDRILDFTDKCKRGAERERIALIRTADLFNVTRYILENGDESFKLKCRESIKAQLGKVVVFPTTED